MIGARGIERPESYGRRGGWIIRKKFLAESGGVRGVCSWGMLRIEKWRVDIRESTTFGMKS